jgi:Tol biopolymer transport system component
VNDHDVTVVLKRLIEPLDDEVGSWDDVLGRAAEPRPEYGDDVLDRAGAKHRRRRPFASRRMVAVASVILVGGLLVTPAVGIGDRLFGLFESDPGPPGGRTPIWSPAGKKIAYLARRQRGKWDMYVMNADGGGQRRLIADVSLTAPSWSPDGRKIAVAGPRQGIGIYVVNADGSGQRRLARNGSAPAWSPDGRTIAFVSDAVIYLMNADGSEHRALTKPGTAGRSLAWSPDGRKLAFLREEGCGQGCFHVIVMNPDGSSMRDLTPHLRGGPGQGAADPAWSPDSRTIAYVRRASHPWSRPGTILVVKPDGSGQRRLTWVPADYAAPAWSPDGRKLAFVTNRDGNSEVYVMNADGSGRRNLTLDPAYDGDPMWSPDGRRIAFVSNRDGVYGIHVMNADGSGQRRLTQR